jgi:uncharacterized membrane protein (TIGR02234 family)
VAAASNPTSNPTASASGAARTRAVVVGGIVAGAALVLLASAQTWIDAVLTIPGLPSVTVSANGRTIAPLVPAVALLALGGAVALLLVGGIGRRLIAVLVGAFAIASVIVAVNAVRDTTAAVRGSLIDAAGISAVPPDGAITASATSWPWIAALGMALVAGCAVAAQFVRWPNRARRYDTASSSPARTDAGTDGSATAPTLQAPEGGIDWWDAIERGEDPTARD